MTSPILFLLVLSLATLPLSARRRFTRLTVSDVIEKANKNLAADTVVYDDITPSKETRNAVPCTSGGCRWPKNTKTNEVYVPYTISPKFNQADRSFILETLREFNRISCVRFITRRLWHRDHLHFESGNGCWSYLGRQGGSQVVSLQSNACLFTHTVQHELLHALGFHHEHVRSDRDSKVEILWENIELGKEHNFNKETTNNFGTQYDFSSVLHYSKNAFSIDNLPTIVSRSNQRFGFARSMSRTDIERVNKLYCS